MGRGGGGAADLVIENTKPAAEAQRHGERQEIATQERSGAIEFAIVPRITEEDFTSSVAPFTV